MHYMDELGQWQESREVIEIFAGGAIARYGPHKVIWTPNAHSPGALDMEARDGQRFRSHVLALAYTSAADGRSVLIAEVKDCTGQVAGNQVAYVDAFTDIQADLRYTYTRAGLEQDVILLQQPPSPADYGLDPATTRLELFTEFIEAGQPQIQAVVLRQDLVDQQLDFGSFHIGIGHAFPLRAAAGPGEAVFTAKSWEALDGRVFLIESVEYPAIAPYLQELPRAAVPRPERRAQAPAGRNKLFVRRFPAAPPIAKPGQRDMRLAALPAPQRGFVLDYTTLNGSLTNYTFQGDTTYYLSGSVYLYGTNNLIEGGAVLKYARNAKLDLKGALHCATDLYRPALLTAVDDANYGEPISGAGQLSGTYAAPAINIDYYASGKLASLTNLHILYATTGVSLSGGYGGAGHELHHVQIVSGTTGINVSYATVRARNALLWNLMYGASGYYLSGSWEHTTFNSIYSLVPGSMAFTNCLVTGVSSGTNYVSGAGNVIRASASGVYQAAGKGYHYLTNNSPYRDAGTTNINPALAAELKLRTTYPPIVLTNILFDTVLTPQAGRDTDVPDVGYHYSPLDFYASGVLVSNATVLATNSVAVGIDLGTFACGFNLSPGRYLSVGDPVRPCSAVRAHTAQEGSAGTQSGAALFYDGNTPTTASNELRLRFTEVVTLASDGFVMSSGRKFGAIEALHARVYNPRFVLNSTGTNGTTVGLTNTLWDRGIVQLGATGTAAGVTMHLRNNLWRKVSLDLVGGTTNWTVRDELFDSMVRLVDNSSPVQNCTNAHFQTTYNLSGGVGIISLTNLIYEAGPLGHYYQPTNSPQLINKGSRTADLAQLFHFTTTTNQVKETNSVVDIGIHYVAVTNSAGVWVPVDTDGDGPPDYLEDANGNGVWNDGESNWNDTSARAPDTNEVVHLQTYTPLK